MSNDDRDFSAEIDDLKATLTRIEGARGGGAIELTDGTRAALPKHLQEPPMEKDLRRAMVRSIPSINGLPAVLKDGNGLALRGINNKHVKDVINTTFPLLQNLELDLLRSLLQAFTKLDQGEDPGAAIETALELCCDNLKHLGRTQLLLSLKAHDLQASESLMDPTSRLPGDNNIIQRPHLEAAKQLSEAQQLLDRATRRPFSREQRFQPFRSRPWRGRGGGRPWSRPRYSRWNGSAGVQQGSGPQRPPYSNRPGTRYSNNNQSKNE